MRGVPEAGFSGRVQAIVHRATHVTAVHYKDVTGSTNDDAMALARAGAPHGTLVVADAQKTGRGRQGRAWQSPAGKGLWMSWILRPNLAVNRSFWVSAAAAVALVETAARTAGAFATLRWPNDVMAGNRKLAGLLAETSGTGDHLDFLVLGVGLNVNQAAADFDPAFAAEATSLSIAGGHELDRALVLAAFIEAFEFLYATLERDQGRAVRAEWLARCPLIGKRVTVAGPGLDFTGTATGLADDGALIVARDGTGAAPERSTEVRAADVRLVRELE